MLIVINIAPGNTGRFNLAKKLMNHYELLYLIAATYSEDELIPFKQKIKELIEKKSGKITLEDNLGKKKFAYPIKQVRHGYYLLYEFDLPPENLKALERSLKLTPEVLRHMVVGKKFQTPSLIEITAEKVKKEKVQKEKEEKKKSDKDKIKLEDLDQRLDEILEGDIM